MVCSRRSRAAGLIFRWHPPEQAPGKKARGAARTQYLRGCLSQNHLRRGWHRALPCLKTIVFHGSGRVGCHSDRARGGFCKSLKVVTVSDRGGGERRVCGAGESRKADPMLKPGLKPLTRFRLKAVLRQGGASAPTLVSKGATFPATGGAENTILEKFGRSGMVSPAVERLREGLCDCRDSHLPPWS